MLLLFASNYEQWVTPRPRSWKLDFPTFWSLLRSARASKVEFPVELEVSARREIGVPIQLNILHVTWREFCAEIGRLRAHEYRTLIPQSRIRVVELGLRQRGRDRDGRFQKEFATWLLERADRKWRDWPCPTPRFIPPPAHSLPCAVPGTRFCRQESVIKYRSRARCSRAMIVRIGSPGDCHALVAAITFIWRQRYERTGSLPELLTAQHTSCSKQRQGRGPIAALSLSWSLERYAYKARQK